VAELLSYHCHRCPLAVLGSCCSVSLVPPHEGEEETLLEGRVHLQGQCWCRRRKRLWDCGGGEKLGEGREARRWMLRWTGAVLGEGSSGREPLIGAH
jgi:hypothetical protein